MKLSNCLWALNNCIFYVCYLYNFNFGIKYPYSKSLAVMYSIVPIIFPNAVDKTQMFSCVGVVNKQCILKCMQEGYTLDI